MLMCFTSCATKQIVEDDYYDKYVYIYNLLEHLPKVPQAPAKLENMDWHIISEGMFALPAVDAYRLLTWNEQYDIYLYDMDTFKQQLNYIKKSLEGDDI